MSETYNVTNSFVMQKATYTRNNTGRADAITYSQTTREGNALTRENYYTYTRDSSSTHFSNTQTWTMRSSGRTSYISGRRTSTQRFSNTQSWTMRSSSSIRYATYTRANTNVGWQSTISTRSSSGTNTTSQTNGTLPFSYTASSLYTRTSTFSTTNSVTTRITGYGTSGNVANATSYRETFSTAYWWATSKNASSTSSSGGIEYNTSRTVSGSGTLTTASQSTTLPTMENKTNSFYTRTLTFSSSNVVLASSNIGYRSNGQSVSIVNTIATYISSISQTLATVTWSATSKNATSLKPGTLLGAWQTTSMASTDVYGGYIPGHEPGGIVNTNYNSGTYHSSLSNNSVYSWTGLRTSTTYTTSRQTGYGTSGTASNATSYRETMQSYNITYSTSRSTMSTTKTIPLPAWQSTITVETGSFSHSFFEFRTVSTLYNTVSSHTRVSNSYLETDSYRDTRGTSGTVSDATSYRETMVSYTTTHQFYRSTSYNTISSGSTTVDTYSVSTSTLGTQTLSTTLFGTLTSRYIPWYSSRSTTYQRTYTETL